jgi:hypothetical protein
MIRGVANAVLIPAHIMGNSRLIAVSSCHYAQRQIVDCRGFLFVADEVGIDRHRDG